MKYEVGKAYLHDGSAECPLPQGSSASYLNGNDYDCDGVENIPWMRVLCFVPIFIPTQPFERWVVVDQDGDLVCFTTYEATARRNAANCDGRRVILMREVPTE